MRTELELDIKMCVTSSCDVSEAYSVLKSLTFC